MKKILIIGTVWPEPKSSAAGVRMLGLIRLFIEQDFEVHFASSAEFSEFSFDLESIGVSLQKIKTNDPGFDSYIKDLQADFVLFDRFMTEEQFGWKVRESSPKTMTVLDTEDLHFLREARELALKNKAQEYENYLFSDKAKRELAAILRCDLSIIISEFEFKLLTEKFAVPADILVYLPFFIRKMPGICPVFEERKNYLFIGNFYHEPNVDAVMVLKNEIWPRIRKQDKTAEIMIYGAYMPKKITQLHNEKDGFLIMGRAEEVADVMKNARVFLAPLRFGAGQKGKLLDAMLNGLPSVTTSIGAESMFGEWQWNGQVTDDWDDFAHHAIQLYKDEEKWLKAEKNAEILLKKRYLVPLYSTNFIKDLLAIKSRLSAHRQKHFIGQVLNHNSLNSYKYLSKWIEEKNKNS